VASFALRGGNVWDGLSESASEGTVVIDEGRVAAVGGGAGAAENIDISGCTVIPGLIEGHAHLCFNAKPDWRAVYDSDSPSRMLVRMAGFAQEMLRAGITTVRDLGAPTGLAVELRDAIRAGLIEGPSLLVAGAPITTSGGHCWFMGGEADGELEARKRVREHVRAGVDWIKVMATGGNMTPGTNTLAAQFRVEELAAMREEAHRLGRRVTAHAHGTEGIRAAVDAGLDMIEHCTFNGPDGIEFDRELIDRIAATGTIVSPTVNAGYPNWANKQRLAERARVLEAQASNGSRIIMSTDCGIPTAPHAALGGGIRAMASLAKLSNAAALKLATSTSAELLGLKDRGVIASGRRADLVVLEGDPLIDLAALDRVRLVVAGGVVVHRAA
jgi:imidazolonepropionase-like amidohydrolase